MTVPPGPPPPGEEPPPPPPYPGAAQPYPPQWPPPGPYSPYPGYPPYPPYPPPRPPGLSRPVAVILGIVAGVVGYLPLAFMLHPVINKHGAAMSFTAESAIDAAVVAGVAALLLIAPKARFFGLGVLLGAAFCFVVLAGVCAPMFGGGL